MLLLYRQLTLNYFLLSFLMKKVKQRKQIRKFSFKTIFVFYLFLDIFQTNVGNDKRVRKRERILLTGKKLLVHILYRARLDVKLCERQNYVKK